MAISPKPTPLPTNVDVLIVGGGPVGLIITNILLQSGLKVLTIEQHERAQQKQTGRAFVSFPGSLELLDLIGIYDRISDTGFIVKDNVTYKNGEATTSRGWSFIQRTLDAGHTYLNFALNLRQQYIEEALRTSIAELDPKTLRQATLVNYGQVTPSDYPVVATVEVDGESFEIRSKYLIGADGGHSTVRNVGRFQFPGTSSPHRWVRMDGVYETNMPYSRSRAVAIESNKYGNVLWGPEDNGRTRIGFLCPPEVAAEEDPSKTKDALIKAAKEAVHPFSLDILKLDWWTIYSIGQHVATTYRKGSVFLAGDAAHTHSSGNAQGMNTGIHDAVNLAWKLGGVLKGYYDHAILETYDPERRTAAERVIQLDKDISSLISRNIPSHFNAPPDANADEYLDQVYSANADFIVGLGVSYGPNILNQLTSKSSSAVIPGVRLGYRAPDAEVYRSGASVPMTLRSLFNFTGRFFILIFAGKLERTAEAARLNEACATMYASLREYLDSPESFTSTLSPAFEFFTLLNGTGSLQTAETIGVQPVGKVLLDPTGSAFERFQVGEEGGVVVVRPDGIVSHKLPLKDCGPALGAYFKGFVMERVGMIETEV